MDALRRLWSIICHKSHKIIVFDGNQQIFQHIYMAIKFHQALYAMINCKTHKQNKIFYGIAVKEGAKDRSLKALFNL